MRNFAVSALIAVVMMVGIYSPSLAVERTPPPPHIDSCVRKGADQLLSIGRNGASAEAQKNQMWSVFNRMAHPYWLGARTYGGANWKSLAKQGKNTGLWLYFDYLRNDGQTKNGKPGRDLSKTEYSTRLADHPEKFVTSRGFHQVVVTLNFNDGGSRAVSVVVDDNCRLIDILHIRWISSLLKIGILEGVLRQQ